MVKVLVTGGAGFIGFEFRPLGARHAPRLADHHARQADLRRPTREPARPRGQRAASVRQGRHRATPPSRRRSSGGRHRRAFRGRDATWTDRSWRPANSSGRTCSARSCCSRRRADAADCRDSSRSRPTRSTAACPSGHSRETDELRPRNPYSASKAGRGSSRPTATGRRMACPSMITRASNNYGPHQFPEKVIPLFITNAIDGIPLPLYGDGLQRA